MSAIITRELTAQTQPQQTRPLAQPAQRKNLYGLYVFFILFAATFLNGLDASEFTSAANVIGRELHLTLNDIGVLASAFTIFLTISIIPIGLWADRAKRSHVIAACLAVWSLATALTSLASNFAGLFITRMFTGIGEAGYAPAGTSLVGDFYKEDKRATVMSWLSVAGLVGPILGMVLGGVIAGLGPGSWKLAFLVTGIPGLILAFFAWHLREPARRQSPSPDAPMEAISYNTMKPAEVAATLRAILRIKPFIYLTIFGILTTFTSTAMVTYFPTLLQQHDTLGLTSAQASLFAALALGPTGIGGVLLGGYIAGWLNRRYRGANALICALSVLIAAPLNLTSLLIMGTHNIVLFSAVMIPAFFINIMHLGPMSAALLDVTPAEIRASAVAINTFAQRILGTALAPLCIGMLAGYFDPTGLDFLHNMAGHDLLLALMLTSPLAMLAAGISSILCLRHIRHDQAVA